MATRSALRGELDEARARQLYARGAETVTFLLVAMARRARPERIDERRAHRWKCCPDCGGKRQRCTRSRTRIIEDIPEEITPVVTEDTLHRDYCPHCKKDVEPVVPDAMPGATLEPHIVGLTRWFHFGLGITISQVIEILSYHCATHDAFI